MADTAGINTYRYDFEYMGGATLDKRQLLSAQAVNDALVTLNADAVSPWEMHDNKLTRRYDFKTFDDAFSFMSHAALSCEKLDHHPRWTNVYNVVEISLFTFKVKGLTSLDFDLAHRMENFAKRLLA